MQRIQGDQNLYTVIGSDYQSPDLNVYTATLGNAAGITDQTAFYLVNTLDHALRHADLLAGLLSMGGRGAKYFLETFTWEDKLCVAAPRHRGVGLIAGMQSGRLDGHYTKRFGYIRELLFILSDLHGLPAPFQLAATRAKNIVVDSQGQVRVNLSLDHSVMEQGDLDRALYRNLAALLSLIFSREAEGGKHRRLQLVLDKCNKGLYSSIGEFMREIDVLERGFETPDLKGQGGAVLAKLKKLGKRFIWVGYAAVVVFAIWFLFNMGSNSAGNVNSDIAVIGNYVYAGGVTLSAQELGGATIDPARDEALAIFGGQYFDVQLPPTYDIEFSDYVVQPGETFASISMGQYGTENFQGALCDFNGFARDFTVRAGMVIRLPHTEQLFALVNIKLS